MPTLLNLNTPPQSTFRIRRRVNPDGFSTDIDTKVARELDTLAELLGKRVFAQADEDPEPCNTPIFEVAQRAASKPKAINAKGEIGKGNQPLLGFAALLSPLTPQRHPTPQGDRTAWDGDSLADRLSRCRELQRAATLAERIDIEPGIAQMKYALLGDLDDELAGFTPQVRAVFARPALVDWLVAVAWSQMHITDPASLRQFIFNNPRGLRSLFDYATIGAARVMIAEQQLKVRAPNDDTGSFIRQLQQARVGLTAVAFEAGVKEVIRAFMFDRDEEKLIDLANLGKLSLEVRAQLVRMIQRSPIPIDASNAERFLPGMLMQLLQSRSAGGAGTAGDDPSDADFEVQFEGDTEGDGSAEISKSAVLCAAQLYHGMVLGDELDVLGAVHYLVFQRPHIMGGMRISDPVLREDLQLYALDNEFANLKPRRGVGFEQRPLTCTRPAERQMFHRQVFDEGHSQVPDDMPLNPEFRQLWKVLMLESARYLERAQASLHPESFVSPQNVMQAVEDLQYNLSNYCTGMATVISPRIDAEINFVMERILKHPDVLRHVVPEGGTWKQVVDRLNTERRQRPGKASTLYNKAVLGKGILEGIAHYTPVAFEDDAVFSGFISKVDAFITTQSILLRPKLDALADERDDDARREVAALPAPSAPPAAKAPATTADEWDF